MIKLPEIELAPDLSHHVYQGKPLYQSRYIEVLKYHEPGLAPALDSSGWFHISQTGKPIYKQRYQRTFGYYFLKAGVDSGEGWFHINPEGNPIYSERYSWVGNYQQNVCVVRDTKNKYFHIDALGTRLYKEDYLYAGDYRDGYACVKKTPTKSFHIDKNGERLYESNFWDVDVYHKNIAIARDSKGWFHIDRSGKELYFHRFASLEPFYNGHARAKGLDGSIQVIDEKGECLVLVEESKSSHFTELSDDLVSYWKTQTIAVAARLGIFDFLPDDTETLSQKVGLPNNSCLRLLRGLWELGLVDLHAPNWKATKKGEILRSDSKYSLRNAALLWSEEHFFYWSKLGEALRHCDSPFVLEKESDWFSWIENQPNICNQYFQAMKSYAKYDYNRMAKYVKIGNGMRTILDAGCGSGELLFEILSLSTNLEGFLFDREEVINQIAIPEELKNNCGKLSGDIFGEWPIKTDIILLSRVLHDWDDSHAKEILVSARNSLNQNGKVIIFELLLNHKNPNGSLLDLNMLIMTGGKERYLENIDELLSSAGLRLANVTNISNTINILEAVLD